MERQVDMQVIVQEEKRGWCWCAGGTGPSSKLGFGGCQVSTSWWNDVNLNLCLAARPQMRPEEATFLSQQCPL